MRQLFTHDGKADRNARHFAGAEGCPDRHSIQEVVHPIAKYDHPGHGADNGGLTGGVFDGLVVVVRLGRGFLQ